MAMVPKKTDPAMAKLSLEEGTAAEQRGDLKWAKRSYERALMFDPYSREASSALHQVLEKIMDSTPNLQDPEGIDATPQLLLDSTEASDAQRYLGTPSNMLSRPAPPLQVMDEWWKVKSKKKKKNP